MTYCQAENKADNMNNTRDIKITKR